jgi:hypothetical protein
MIEKEDKEKKNIQNKNFYQNIKFFFLKYKKLLETCKLTSLQYYVLINILIEEKKYKNL